MQQNQPPVDDKRISQGDDFFIPDLCAPSAVLIAVLLAELVVLLHVMAMGSLAMFDWRTLATNSLFAQWITLLCIALICLLRPWLSRLNVAVATSACLGVVLFITLLSSFVGFRMGAVLAPQYSSALDWSIRNALLAVTLAAIALRYAYLHQRLAIQQRSELQLRLDALRAKIRPHFLFNTLNSIASLITVQPDRAEQAIEDVSELFRAALQDDGRDSSVGDELHLCRLYLDIEKLRLSERLDVSWSVEPGVEDARLPALLLQPLVENAIYHGIAQRAEGGEVTIAVATAQEAITITVENPVPGSVSAPVGSGQQMAQDNIRQRLAAQYGDGAELAAGLEGDLYRASITLPLDTST